LRAKDRIVDPLRRVRRRGFEEASWDDALDEAERLLREADGSVHVVLSGSETNELAYGLAKLATALGGSVQVPDPDTRPLGRPLSELADTGAVADGDVPLDELAPVAELWAKEARRRGGANGGEPALRVPRTPNGIGINHAVARAGAADGSEPRAPALLIVSGDEAASDPAVRELAEGVQSVIVLTMFQGLAVGWADLVLPGTSYLERDGSLTNMEGRVQRLRRAVLPPGPDELAWLAKLAERFGVELSPYASLVHEELFGRPFAELGETASLRLGNDRHVSSTVPGTVEESRGLRLVRYRPLFSGPAVERVEKFRFQRPDGTVDLARDDAHRLGVRDGDEVNVRTNGTSATLRARIRRNLRAGVVLVPEGSAGELEPGSVEVTPA
jgi:predicted molibdopterin-dependent oxidoreductase YjgC